jgi:manganese/zinc/iron transport system permease protein
VLLLLVVWAWRPLEICTFDPDYALVLGYRVKLYEFALNGLLAAAIVIGLQRVGATLMSALVVAPAVAARQCSDRLKWVVFLAGVFGGASGLIGVWVSDKLSTPTRMIPTGPAIVLCAGAFAFAAILGRLLVGIVRRASTQRPQTMEAT